MTRGQRVGINLDGLSLVCMGRSCTLTWVLCSRWLSKKDKTKEEMSGKGIKATSSKDKRGSSRKDERAEGRDKPRRVELLWAGLAE